MNYFVAYRIRTALKTTKELEPRSLQPRVRRCSNLPSYRIPQSFSNRVCSSLRRRVPSYLTFQVTQPYLIRSFKVKTWLLTFMHYCLPKVRVRQQWSWRWVWTAGTMTTMYSLQGHWIVCDKRPHYKTGRGRITRRAEDCMHSSPFSHWQSNLHPTQPTYSLLCSPSRPQAVCNRHISIIYGPYAPGTTTRGCQISESEWKRNGRNGNGGNERKKGNS